MYDKRGFIILYEKKREKMKMLCVRWLKKSKYLKNVHNCSALQILFAFMREKAKALINAKDENKLTEEIFVY